MAALRLTTRPLSRALVRPNPFLHQRRHIFKFLGNIFAKGGSLFGRAQPTLAPDNLFHPFSQSPFSDIRQRGETIKKIAPCPICVSETAKVPEETRPLPKAVKHECPDCGWPTHCTEEHWKADEEHSKYCARLREVNEDDHDLRSGRRLREFEVPGPHDTDDAISFANWDVFWYTRGFPSMDTERSRRHASKLYTYPMTIGSILHQFSYLTLSSQRLTPEGSRSLGALRQTLHVPIGAPEVEEATASKPQVRVFILGARSESALPPHVWEQLTMLFPAGLLHLYFIGPQVSLPKPPTDGSAPFAPPPESGPAAQAAEAAESAAEPEAASSESKSLEVNKPKYLPTVYEPPAPAPIPLQKYTRSSLKAYGVPSYTTPYTKALTLTGMQANYMDVHAQFQETYNPYTDCFFLFHPGLGFPSPTTVAEDGGDLMQVVSPTEWGPVMPMLLATKCPIFITGFSPADVERDVKSLASAPGVAGEFDWLITPGPNAFGSEKWEVADFDPRVMLKTNWGIWGIRGKRKEVRERSSFSLFN